MPEKFWREYQSLSWIPEPSHLDFYLGPVNSKNILSIKKSLDKVCDLDSMKINVCERAGETFWLHFLLSGKGWTEKYIRNEFAKGLYVNIGKEYLKFLKNSRIEMGNASLQEERIGFKRGLDDYNSVTVFVKNIDNVLKVMKKLKNMGMNCDNRLAEDIIWANQLKQFSSRLFFVVVGTVSLLVLINIYLSFTQKIHSSIPEIGILKAFGHGGLTIIIIQVVETFIIWLIAMPLGTFAAFYAGKQTETFIINTFHLDVQLRMFVLTPEIILITGIASLAAAGFAAVVAAFFAALKNPSEALSYKK
ncbi:MAG: FtsX-like permease family protein [Victivallaceae bacterium]